MATTDTLLESKSDARARLYIQPIQDLFVTFITNNASAARDARDQLAEVMRDTMGAGEILGAKLMLAAAAEVQEPSEKMRHRYDQLLAFADQQVLPRVTFEEALEDMVNRTPVTLRRAAERTAQAIAERYAGDSVIAFARAAEASVTKEAQSFIARSIRLGISEGESGKRLSMSINNIRKRSKAWSEGYSRMVFRTNVNQSLTAGRFRQAQDPDIKAVVPAFRFDAVNDGDSRPNHAAADGIIMATDNTNWSKIAPPLGYNCRCQISHVSVVELKAMGRIDKRGDMIQSRVPGGAKPDAGFNHSGRPDLGSVN